MSRAKPKAAPKPDDGALDAKQPTLEGEWVPVDSLHLDPANVRRHPERNLDAIKASLARFGQQKPIVVDADGIVRAGNGTLEAVRALGWPRVGIVRTHLRGAEATAYAIADNRTSDLAEWDEVGLAEQLQSLRSEEFDLGAVGYTEGEVDELIGRLTDEIAGAVVDDPQGEWQGMPEFKNEAVQDIQLVVYFPTMEAKLAFSEQVGQNVNAETKFVWFPKSAKPVRQSAETMTVDLE
jgi:hypothetical protein